MIYTMSNNKVIFVYKFKNEIIETAIDIPNRTSIDEIANKIITKHKLPIYKEKDIKDALKIFINEYLNVYYNQVSLLVQNGKQNINAFEDISKLWEKIMKDEIVDYGEKRCASNEELFATVYHKMVHSPALDTMLQLEYMYAQTIHKKCNEKDEQVHNLLERQLKEMSEAIERLETDMTELKINELAAQHLEDIMFLNGQLRSELDTIKIMQRKEYREWLMHMLEQNQTNNSLPTPSSPAAPTSQITQIHYGDGDKNMVIPILEESFTIHLGSQLKQMHNIRILSANVMNLCSVQNETLTPQLLQTSLGLYSNDLHGLVLIHNNIIESQFSKGFRDTCQRSTEFHFNHIDDQLETINEIKEQLKFEQGKNKGFNIGDFYITKHSNLSQVHVVFHIVTDDSIKSNDINSRHPVVLGLRNILKISCSNDITSLTIPLLLDYELSEEMTISWCEKRAELVFKCVKGFMIEMASWGGSDIKNLQFLLPEDISGEVFQSLTEMLPRIFKVSNPLMLKTK